MRKGALGFYLEGIGVFEQVMSGQGVVGTQGFLDSQDSPVGFSQTSVA